MKTFLPFKVGQSLRRSQSDTAPEGFSFNIPQGDALVKKGAVFAFVSSTDEGADCRVIARRLVNDYSATSQVWSVSEAIERVLAAADTFLARCDFAMVVIKGATANIVQHGQSTLVRYRDGVPECLSNSSGDRVKKIDVATGDVLCMAPHGLREHMQAVELTNFIRAKEEDLNHTAYGMASAAQKLSTSAPPSMALIEVADLPASLVAAPDKQALPIPPELAVGDKHDGLEVLATLSESSRSRVFLVSDGSKTMVMKCPAIDSSDSFNREAFLMQEWLLQRFEHPALVKTVPTQQQRQSLYILSEYIEAPTLRHWLEASSPSVEDVLAVVEQIGRALLSMHRAGVYHRAISLDNCLVDTDQQVHIVDFGAAYMRGVGATGSVPRDMLTGTWLAPELAAGEPGGEASDQYMLASLAYGLLSGGEAPSGKRYTPLSAFNRHVSPDLDRVLQRALSQKVDARHGDIGEFLHELRCPSSVDQPHTLARHFPVVFWQGLSALLALAWLITLTLLFE